MPITTPEELRQHIELAIRVELSTIPPYLYAMYSLEDLDSEPALLIRSIVTEEMLHAALATNLLLAVGGEPDFRSTRYMPSYPMDLPHHVPPLRLNLEPSSEHLVREVFMRIEQPEARDAPAEPDAFETLGQFYHALESGLVELSSRHPLFDDPQVERQMSDPRFYQPVEMDSPDSGGLLEIYDLVSAVDAIEIIVHQGEGLSDERWSDPAHQELTHYHKLLEILEGRAPLGAVRAMPTNPRTKDYPPELQTVSHLFNGIYRGLYLIMDRMFSGDSNQPKAVGALYLFMADVMAQVARFLSSRRLENGFNAAPTFELYEFSTESPLGELEDLAERAADDFTEMTTVHEAIRGFNLIL
ncbi:MAG TPA: ferritin-like protein [Acidimicrobiia bacterium]